MLINAEINIAFSSGTHTPFVQVFRILCMTSTPQPLSSSQIQARTQETSVSLTQSSCFSEFDLSCSLLVLLQVILLQKCCPKHGTLGLAICFLQSGASMTSLHKHTWWGTEMQAVLQTPLHRENTSTVDMTNVRLAGCTLWSQVINLYHEIFFIVYLYLTKREPCGLVSSRSRSIAPSPPF